MIGADAGTFAAATTRDRQSCPVTIGAALVKWRLFEPVVSTPDGMVNDLTSQSDPLASNGPGRRSPWKMAGPAATVVPFTMTSWSSNVWPSETTKSRLALPPGVRARPRWSGPRPRVERARHVRVVAVEHDVVAVVRRVAVVVEDDQGYAIDVGVDPGEVGQAVRPVAADQRGHVGAVGLAVVEGPAVAACEADVRARDRGAGEGHRSVGGRVGGVGGAVPEEERLRHCPADAGDRDRAGAVSSHAPKAELGYVGIGDGELICRPCRAVGSGAGDLSIDVGAALGICG